MCFRKLFKRTPVIPHPEEPPNPMATMEYASVFEMVLGWYSGWRVPSRHRDYWDSVELRISTAGTGTISQIPRVTVNLHYTNPGTLAHEMSHISYYLLTEEQKAEFGKVFQEVLQTDKLLKYLYSLPERAYMRTNDIEAHADTYRFLGHKMPESLKLYYPRLF